MTEREKSIVFITDLIESKVRKEREIEYYEEKLKEIEKALNEIIGAGENDNDSGGEGWDDHEDDSE